MKYAYWGRPRRREVVARRHECYDRSGRSRPTIPAWPRPVDSSDFRGARRTINRSPTRGSRSGPRRVAPQADDAQTERRPVPRYHDDLRGTPRRVALRALQGAVGSDGGLLDWPVPRRLDGRSDPAGRSKGRSRRTTRTARSRSTTSGPHNAPSRTCPFRTRMTQIEQLVNNDRMLFEIMYVDPRQAWQEATRVNPQWIGKLPAAPRA